MPAQPAPDPQSDPFPGVGRELAAACLMIEHLALAAPAAASPIVLAALSNAMARQLEAVARLLLSSHLQSRDASSVTVLLHTILDEMSHDTEVKL
jgi:hypothetical protein